MRLVPWLLLVPLVGCANVAEPFSLGFVPQVAGQPVACGSDIDGFGPAGAHAIGLSDLRFYVSNLRFWNHDDEEIARTLDEDEFQYQGAADQVSLIDLTGATDGACADGAISASEGTARTHGAITGTAVLSEVHRVSFDVGVPQALMAEVIAEHSAEGAPSPLAEMYWSWQSGYRHFVFNFTATDGTDDGEGYVHIGSLGCAAEGENALESRDACDKVNTPQADLHDFHLGVDTVAVELDALLDGLTFVTPIMDHQTMQVIGETVGVACHSFPGQADCPPIFGNIGLDQATGTADAAANAVFVRQ